MNAINSLDRTITVVLIAHRLYCSTLWRILHLEKGQISGLGTYNELLQNNPALQLLVRNRISNDS